METDLTFQNYYEVLQCDKAATFEELKKNYQRLVLSTHPDKQEDSSENSEKFSLVQKAWSVLRDPESRKVYDAALSCNEHCEMLLYDSIALEDMNYDSGTLVYSYGCRCSGTYSLQVTEPMPKELIIGCDECSFSIKVKL